MLEGFDLLALVFFVEVYWFQGIRIGARGGEGRGREVRCLEQPAY